MTEPEVTQDDTRRPLRSLLRAAPRALAHGLVFALALVASVLFHLNTYAGRTALTHVVNRALQPVFEGSLSIESIEELAGKKAPFKSEPMMKADVDFTFANIDKAKALLGYSPRISVNEGVRQSYEWYRHAVGELGA